MAELTAEQIADFTAALKQITTERDELILQIQQIQEDNQILVGWIKDHYPIWRQAVTLNAREQQISSSESQIQSILAMQESTVTANDEAHRLLAKNQAREKTYERRMSALEERERNLNAEKADLENERLTFISRQNQEIEDRIQKRTSDLFDIYLALHQADISRLHTRIKILVAVIIVMGIAQVIFALRLPDKISHLYTAKEVTMDDLYRDYDPYNAGPDELIRQILAEGRQHLLTRKKREDSIPDIAADVSVRDFLSETDRILAGDDDHIHDTDPTCKKIARMSKDVAVDNKDDFDVHPSSYKQ